MKKLLLHLRNAPNMDTISIHALIVPTRIGITQEERSTEQTVKVSVEITCDTKKAGETDAIEDTIDYEVVANAIKELGKTQRNTVEKFAEDIAEKVLKDFGGTSTKITIEKFVLPDTEAVSVTITRP